jgi:hypothetical protein
VLRLIDELECIDVFLRQGINDMWFPFTLNTLPAALQPSVQSKFIETQNVACIQSKSLQLENREQKHVHFAKDDPLPFQVIARLGGLSAGRRCSLGLGAFYATARTT